jgi:hypothetical protein
MASQKHLAIRRKGVETWNKWREESTSVKPDLEGANLQGADLREADFLRADFEGADISTVRSFYRTKLDPKILSKIKAKWPEKLATFWNYTKKDWVIDNILLEQIKKPGWPGW